MMAFCPEHPKWDQNPKFTPLSKTTSIKNLFHMRSPPPRVRQVRQSWAVLIFCIYLRRRFHIPRQQELGFWIPNVILRLKSRFQSPGYQRPRAKISQILEFGLPCTWDQIWNKELSLLWLYYNECGRRWSNEIKYRHLSKIVWTILCTVSKMPTKQ